MVLVDNMCNISAIIIQSELKVFKDIDHIYILTKNYKLPEKILKLVFLMEIYVHFFIHTLSTVQRGHPVSHGEHPVEVPVLISDRRS